MIITSDFTSTTKNGPTAKLPELPCILRAPAPSQALVALARWPHQVGARAPHPTPRESAHQENLGTPGFSGI